MLSRSLITLAAIALLAGCGSGGGSDPIAQSGLNSTSSSSGQVRVLNGSPDAGAIDVKLGSQAASSASLVYRALTGYVTLPYAAYTVTVSRAGTTLLTCTTPAISPQTNYTIVIAGKVAATGAAGLQCQMFNEPTVASGSSNVLFHNASPGAAAAGQNTLAFGTFPPGTQTYSAPLLVQPFTTPSNGLAFTQTFALSVSGANTSPGIGVYANPQTTTTAPATVAATVLPSQAVAGNSGINGSNNTSNTIPYGSSSAFAVYAIDAQAGAPAPFTLVGVDD